jgi:BlaI family transcriptional regulator, penicillinase repressor
MARQRMDLSEGEWAIMRVVWEYEPCAAPGVQEALKKERGWAYTTVKTLMDRMVKKGLLETERIRNLYLYRSAITRSQAQQSEVSKILKRAFSGSTTPMMQFLLEREQLSDEEYRQLESLIRNRRREKETRP